MNYGEAQELLIDGLITHKQDDIIAYGTVRRFYIDQRTEYQMEDLPPKVKPLGRTINNYWLYICPDCGLIHAIHRDLVGDGKIINCGCEPGGKKNSRSRKFIQPDGSLCRIAKKKIILVCGEKGPEG